VGASAENSTLPAWPAYVFGVMTLAALYVLGAALARQWPFHRLALAPAELLDDCIRRGRDARARIIYERLDDWEAAREAATWTLRTANLLHEQFPATWASRSQLRSSPRTTRRQKSSLPKALATLRGPEPAIVMTVPPEESSAKLMVILSLPWINPMGNHSTDQGERSIALKVLRFHRTASEVCDSSL
jgi:hypothetical protein